MLRGNLGNVARETTALEVAYRAAGDARLVRRSLQSRSSAPAAKAVAWAGAGAGLQRRVGGAAVVRLETTRALGA